MEEKFLTSPFIVSDDGIRNFRYVYEAIELVSQITIIRVCLFLR